MFSYCIYCNTLKSGVVATLVESRLNCRVIQPKILQRKWIKGVAFEEIHDFLPGYLFLYADEQIEDFAELYRMTDFYRILGNREQRFLLTGSDLAFAEALYAADGILGRVLVTEESGKLRMVKGTLGEVEGEILRVDRRGRAEVQYTFDGKEYRVWLAYELVEEDRSTENRRRAQGAQ